MLILMYCFLIVQQQQNRHIAYRNKFIHLPNALSLLYLEPPKGAHGNTKSKSETTAPICKIITLENKSPATTRYVKLFGFVAWVLSKFY